MSNLRIESLRINSARLNAENPFPPIFFSQADRQIVCDDRIPDEIRQRVISRRPSSILPYSTQDNYSRRLDPVDHTAVILENEFLRATFLIGMGGRLWSLFHKPTNQELLETGPNIQLANLAIRNAWFSGGVEWNIGRIGHSPFTCEPLFADMTEGENGTPILHLYEWERFSQTPFQIKACLPDGSKALMLTVRILNPNKHPVDVYWWSNIALPTIPGIRVLAPSNNGYGLGFEPGKLSSLQVPIHAGLDITYPENLIHAADIFFQLAGSKKPWIAALNSDGGGFFHASTSKLPGRKLWTWGSSPGGKRWQEFLSPDGAGYIEIQAGITPTQLEQINLPPESEISWMEAYGHLQLDPKVIHAADWQKAVGAVEDAIDQVIPNTSLEATLAANRHILDQKAHHIIQSGSGWGALECLRAQRDDEVLNLPPSLEFARETLTELQSPWLSLLQDGILDPPLESKNFWAGFLVGEHWQKRLQASLNREGGDNWFSRLHLGIMHYQSGAIESAKENWRSSLQQRTTIWAVRNLAVLARKIGKTDEAIENYLIAHRLRPDLVPLVVELGICMREVGKDHDWLEVYSSLPNQMRSLGRLRLLQAQSALAVGNLEIVEKFFRDRVIVDDLREGDNTLSELWLQYQRCLIGSKGEDMLLEEIERYFPVPPEFDFRM